MSVYALHQGLQYEMQSVGEGEWRWSFHPPGEKPRSGRVVGEPEQAMAVARRAIEVWHESMAKAA